MYAGFWKRVGASVIDSLVIWAFYGVLILLFGVLTNIKGAGGFLGSLLPLSILFSILYYPSMECSRFQGTVGKRLCGIIVTDRNGHSISFWRAFIRNLAKIISALPLCIGFMMAGFTERKQALHDLISGSYVSKRQEQASIGQ